MISYDHNTNWNCYTQKHHLCAFDFIIVFVIYIFFQYRQTYSILLYYISLVLLASCNYYFRNQFLVFLLLETSVLFMFYDILLATDSSCPNSFSQTPKRENNVTFKCDISLILLNLFNLYRAYNTIPNLSKLYAFFILSTRIIIF